MTIPLAPLAAEVAHELAPFLTRDDENGNVGAHLIAVLTAPIEQVAEAVREDDDERDGFAIYMDLERCPANALPWLLQFKGVRATPGLSDEAAREEGRLAEGLHRGTAGSMKRAAARHTASRDPNKVVVLERVGSDPYATTVITRTIDTPDPAQTLADILSDKVIGELIQHIVTDDVIWAEATVTWADVDPAVTWADVETADVT